MRRVPTSRSTVFLRTESILAPRVSPNTRERSPDDTKLRPSSDRAGSSAASARPAPFTLGCDREGADCRARRAHARIGRGVRSQPGRRLAARQLLHRSRADSRRSATLPAGYYQELPKLAGDGALAGYPRIYEIVIELIAHTDGRLDEPSVALMMREYQRVTPLTLGELWAIPAMLRMGYLENIRRMALRAARDIADRASADEWVTRLLAATSSDGDRRSASSLAFVHHGPSLTPAFLTRFLQQIRSRRVRLHAAALARAVDGGRRHDASRTRRSARSRSWRSRSS